MKTEVTDYELGILEQLADAVDAHKLALSLTRGAMRDLLLMVRDSPEAKRFRQLVESEDWTVKLALEEMGVAIRDSLLGEID